ncbi:MAG: hypothetical protein DCC68_05245 [Planctomycetota bacterium]|nr:MAG: hypothetical protein DCC68_05245 [Planctomycetota bacterium]
MKRSAPNSTCRTEARAMNGLETKDWVLFAAAAYVAIVSLVRLMIRHRARVSAQLATEIERQQHAKAAEEQRRKEVEKKKQPKAA